MGGHLQGPAGAGLVCGVGWGVEATSLGLQEKLWEARWGPCCGHTGPGEKSKTLDCLEGRSPDRDSDVLERTSSSLKALRPGLELGVVPPWS